MIQLASASGRSFMTARRSHRRVSRFFLKALHLRCHMSDWRSLRVGLPDQIVASLRTARPDETVWMGRVHARIDSCKLSPVSSSSPLTRCVALPTWQAYRCSSSAATTSSRTSAVGQPQDLCDGRAIECAAGAEPREPRPPRTRSQP